KLEWPEQNLRTNTICESFIRGQGIVAEIPITSEALGPGCTGSIHQLLEVSRIIHIESDSGEAKDYAFRSRGAGGLQVWLEAVVAEAQRKEISWFAKSCVGAASVSRGNQNCAGFRSRGKDLLKFLSLDQRNVTGNYECALRAFCLAESRGGFDGVRLADISVANDLEIELASQVRSEVVVCYYRHFGTVAASGDRVAYILDHRVSQCGPGTLVEDGGQALLGILQVLDRDEDHTESRMT